MTRPRLLAALGAAVAFMVLASACFETSVDETGPEPRSISVTGTGEVQAEPDIATVSTGVEVQADTVAEARAGAAEAANAVVAALRANGVEDSDIRTVDFSIRPVYDYSRETPRIIGYFVSNNVLVTVRDVESVGELIDAVAEAGGDAVRFNGISFSHEDPAALTEQARALAIEDARAKAEQLAELTGVTLGSVLSVVETSWASPLLGQARGMEFAMADSAATSIQPGTSAVTVTVQAVWEIEKPEE
ncbi:MAG: DUF541 domain-containing protein [Dehalococcoidia bacterium]|nr:DUF541 domain-containing protein [Dehalococcoidia bacterium]MYI86599.1 DUF541 domain-containing protein [Dehalococcoidia bacterium]